jgi:hypothetical protein
MLWKQKILPISGMAMKNIKDFILQHIDEFECYFSTLNKVVVVILDKELNISEHNETFKKLLQVKNDIVGKKLHSFLLPESQNILPLSDSTKHVSTLLKFISSFSTPISLDCHIFNIDHKKHLILGSQFMLTNEFVLKKMSELTNEMANMARDLHRKNKELETAWSKIKVLSGIIPICMHCKEIRDDQGYWNRLEKFITENSEAQFSHSICPICMKKHYPDFDFEN